jgi:hypothetical protein
MRIIINMDKDRAQAEDRSENRRYISDLSLHQARVLDDVTDAVDRKSATLLGFLALIIALALQTGVPKQILVLDALFLYTGFACLFAGLILLICSITPRTRRFDPNPAKLFDKCWDLDLCATQKEVTKSLKASWLHNEKVHNRKVILFEWAMRMTIGGLVLLAFDILVVRPFGCG